MRINIILPYSEAGKYYEKWASEENYIDFQLEKDRAERCTVSFAATELASYLEMMGNEVCVSDEKQDCLNISIKCLDGVGEEFDILYNGTDIEIVGCGRRGSLYGVYELLEIQGVRWYSPEVEFVPQNGEFVYPKSRHYKYDLPDGRGFHFEDLQNESKSVLLWMARNRMNTHACHSHSKAFQEKLGMIFDTGGHIFEKILNPNNIADDGRYYIDAHKDWYGKRDVEITAANAIDVQFCVSNGELLDYISESVIDKIKTDWENEDCICIDGFDTWGKSCSCEKCRALGNGSDMTLKLMSHIRARINEATARGELREGIKLSFCVYEGTNTMLPPENPVPQNLIDAGDYAQFSPIRRCYAHDFNELCERNSKYAYNDHFIGWLKTGMKISFLEYYNVSRFEDLPIIFTKRIINDVRYYIKSGVAKLLYMHVFLKDWGVRALNHYLLANMSRDCRCDADALVKEYFKNVYGKYADAAEEIYAKIEKATELCASWRAWTGGSVLTALQRWDGKRPEAPLDCDGHLKGKTAECGYESVRLLEESLEGLRAIRERALGDISAEALSDIENAINPIEMLKKKNKVKFFDKLNDDIRGVKYGIDVFKLTALFADYYDSLLENRDDSEALFAKIKLLAEEMSEYTFSVCFRAYEPDFDVRDALKRSQLKDLYYRCIALYNKNYQK